MQRRRYHSAEAPRPQPAADNDKDVEIEWRMTGFDASIDLTIHSVPTGIDVAEAVVRVRAAVDDVPGANWVSVEWCSDAPAFLPWLTLYMPGCGIPLTGERFTHLARRIEAVVTEAIDDVSRAARLRR